MKKTQNQKFPSPLIPPPQAGEGGGWGMGRASTDLKKILVEGGVIKEDDFDALLKEAAGKKQPLAGFLIFRKITTEERLAKLVSEFLKVPLVDLSAEKISQEALQIIPEPIARRHQG